MPNIPKTAEIKAFNGLMGKAVSPKRLKSSSNRQPITALITMPKKPLFLIFRSQHEKTINAMPKIIDVAISMKNTVSIRHIYWACPEYRIDGKKIIKKYSFY